MRTLPLVPLTLACMCLPAVASGQAAAAAAGAARADSVSAPITNIAYEVTFNRATASRGMVEVAMTFTAAAPGAVLLSLPAWTPGAYEISNFARNVIGFEAAARGAPLRWDKLDHDTWRVRVAAAGPVTVHFRAASDELDTAKLWVGRDFTLFNGTNVFLYPEGRSLAFPATVTIATEPDWRITTGMKRVSGTSYSAANFHDLVDMPFFVGSFDVDSALISGKWTRFASYPPGSVSGPARRTVWTQLEQVIPPLVAVFGEAPWDTYTVMQIVDSAFQGASGLEHQNSHVDILSPQFVGSDFQPSLYAHEVFHAWNVKRLRPAELWPYVYSRPQPSPLLWVSEGITDYYADLALVRGRVIDEAGFYSTTAGKINEVRNAPPTALEDASLSTWIQPVDGTGYLYYAKGSLIGFMLDIFIRDASDNARSLDTVMRALYQSTFVRNRGFTAADFWAEVTRAAGGKSFMDFNVRYVDGRDAIPWETILPLAGMRAVQARVPRLGIYSQASAAGVVVTSVDPAGAAAAAGLRAGDVLITVGSIPVDDVQFGERFRGQYATSPEGTALPIRIRRGGQEMTLEGRLMFAPGEVRVEVDPAASDKAQRIRRGLLGR
jgi:predicted metalloprotease with PDZ domain